MKNASDHIAYIQSGQVVDNTYSEDLQLPSDIQEVVILNGGVVYSYPKDFIPSTMVQSGGSLYDYGQDGIITIQSGGFADVDDARTVNVESGGTATITDLSNIENITVYQGGSVALLDSNYNNSFSGTYYIDSNTIVDLENKINSGVDNSYYGNSNYGSILNNFIGDTVEYSSYSDYPETDSVKLTVVSTGTSSNYDYQDTILGINDFLTVSAGQTSIRTQIIVPHDDSFYAPNSFSPAEDVYGTSIDDFVFGGTEDVENGGLSIGAVISGKNVGYESNSLVGELGIDDGGIAKNATVTGFGVIIVGGDGPPDLSNPARLEGVTISSGGEVDVEIDGIVSDVTLLSGGTIKFDNFSHGKTLDSNITGPISGNGTIIQNGANVLNLDENLSDFNGTIQIQSGTLEVGNDTHINGATVSFTSGNSGTLALNTLTGHGISVSGFSLGDKIDLGSVPFNPTLTGKLVGDPVLEVSSGSAPLYDLNLLGTYNGEAVHLASDGHGGTLVTLEEGTPCYCRGTLIRTMDGDVAVEHLQIGDQLQTQSNGLRAIRWIGRRSYSGQFASGNRDVLPVTLRRGALGGGLPTQDLSVSPLHAMFLDGALIPAVMLVNGRSIVQAEGMDEVAYFHIELDSHDVIFANDAPSETFVDDDSRGMFHNAHEFEALYPECEAVLPQYCAPRLEEGGELQVIRDRLIALCDAPVVSGADIEGFVDVVTRNTVAGWARSLDQTEAVTLDIVVNECVVGQVVADQPRADVGGNVGFTFMLPQGLAAYERHVIEVRRAHSGSTLGHSPWVLDQLERHDARDQAEAVIVTDKRCAVA